MRKIWPLQVKSNFWPSCGGIIWNKQENGQKTRKWCLQTGAPGRMSSIGWEPGNPRLTDDRCIFKNFYEKYRSKSVSTNQ